jgi:hypothetical protein
MSGGRSGASSDSRVNALLMPGHWQKSAALKSGISIGASEGIRTLDIHLGKVTLYQAELRSLPFSKRGEP